MNKISACTKELESRIATKNEEIRTLKAGLYGIVRQYISQPSQNRDKGAR